VRKLVGGLLLLAALALAPGAARGEGRIALLIGNAAYADPAFDLRNPAQDARALAGALAPLGFATEVVTDASRAAAEAALEDFARRAAGADVALFFFAGHGVQIAGENRLLTAGFDALSREAIERESLSLDAVRAAFAAAKPKLGLIVLDACRNNPLAESGLAARGLARAQGGAGLLIAYATDPGNVAYDGVGANSIFTTALLEAVATPGLEVRLMFGRVRQAVVTASAGQQVPWVEEAVLDEHYLNPGPPAAAPDPAIAEDVAAWRAATEAGDAVAYRRYLERAPDGLFRAFAEERIAQLAAGTAGPDDAAVIVSADPAKVTAALATLGFLASRDPQPDLGAAFAAYARQAAGGQASVEGLYLDAAQVMVMLGAGTAQRIRTDMAALATIGTTLDVAGRARAELAALAETQPAARAALPEADADIAAIRETEARVQARLDQSRSFYAELIARGSRDFRPYLARSLAGLLERPRMPGDGRVMEDAGRFVRHATADGVERAEGSMAWLADFLPRD
jgi:uncharacterized caspase-like protein